VGFTGYKRESFRTPFRTGRSFTGGMPRGLFGSIGLMAAHSSSVSSSRMIRRSQIWRLNHG